MTATVEPAGLAVATPRDRSDTRFRPRVVEAAWYVRTRSASCPVLREPARRPSGSNRACSSVGQSTRLISVGSVVQIYPGPPGLPRRRDSRLAVSVPIAGSCAAGFPRGISSAGRAPGLQPGGHRFEPGILHQSFAAAASWRPRRAAFGPMEGPGGVGGRYLTTEYPTNGSFP